MKPVESKIDFYSRWPSGASPIWRSGATAITRQGLWERTPSELRSPPSLAVCVGEGFRRKKSGKSVVFCQTVGGGSRRVLKSQTSILEKYFFQWACRIILGPPKHVLHLVWSCLDTYLALKTTLKVSLYSYLNPANSGQIMTINTGNLFVFEVGPSVKLVSAIKDAIFNKKMGVNFILWRRQAV